MSTGLDTGVGGGSRLSHLRASPETLPGVTSGEQFDRLVSISPAN
jgi:hypothetical protein